jgi:hypothetical protein
MDTKERRKERNRAYYIAHPEKWTRTPKRAPPENRAIYILRNTSDARIYVGETVCVDVRWRQHKRTTCVKYPAEGWSCETYIKMPSIEGLHTTFHMSVEQMVIIDLLRRGHTLLNKNRAVLYPWSDVETHVVPHLDKFAPEDRAKVEGLIASIYPRPPPPA